LVAFQFIEYHDGRCAICGERPSELIVDHDHWCGLVRGYLCKSCNILEGKAQADERPLFVRYRRRHPSAILNYFEGYTTNGTSQIILNIRRKEDIYARRREAAMERFSSGMEWLVHHSSELDAPRMSKAVRKLIQVWQRFELPTSSPLGDGACVRADMMKTMCDLLYIVEEVSQKPETGMDEELQDFIARLSGASRAICYYDRFGLAWSQG
jgi:hypothetical protein